MYKGSGARVEQRRGGGSETLANSLSPSSSPFRSARDALGEAPRQAGRGVSADAGGRMLHLALALLLMQLPVGWGQCLPSSSFCARTRVHAWTHHVTHAHEESRPRPIFTVAAGATLSVLILFGLSFSRRSQSSTRQGNARGAVNSTPLGLPKKSKKARRKSAESNDGPKMTTIAKPPAPHQHSSSRPSLVNKSQESVSTETEEVDAIEEQRLKDAAVHKSRTASPPPCPSSNVESGGNSTSKTIPGNADGAAKMDNDSSRSINRACAYKGARRAREGDAQGVDTRHGPNVLEGIHGVPTDAHGASCAAAVATASLPTVQPVTSCPPDENERKTPSAQAPVKSLCPKFTQAFSEEANELGDHSSDRAVFRGKMPQAIFVPTRGFPATSVDASLPTASPSTVAVDETPSPSVLNPKQGLCMRTGAGSSPPLQPQGSKDSSMTLALRRQSSNGKKQFAANLSIVTPNVAAPSPTILRITPPKPLAFLTESIASGPKHEQSDPKFQSGSLGIEEGQSYRSSTNSCDHSGDANSEVSIEGCFSPGDEHQTQAPGFVFESLAEHLKAVSSSSPPQAFLERDSPPHPLPTPMQRHTLHLGPSASPARPGFWIRAALRPLVHVSPAHPSSPVASVSPRQPSSPPPPGLTPRAGTRVLSSPPPGLLPSPCASTHRTPQRVTSRESQPHRGSLSDRATQSDCTSSSSDLVSPLERKNPVRLNQVGFTRELLDGRALSTTPTGAAGGSHNANSRFGTPTTPTMASRLRNYRQSPRASPGGEAPWTMPGAYGEGIPGTPSGRRAESRVGSIPGTPRILSLPKKKKNRAAQAARLRQELKSIVGPGTPSKRMHAFRRQTL